MKKILLGVILILILAIVVVGCSSSNDNDIPSKSNETVTEPSNNVPEVTSSSVNNSILGDYEVTIKSAQLGKDYEGNPIIVVTYDWTNNSEDTVAAAYSVVTKAFQEGIELDYAIVIDDEIYDASANLKEIRPGVTLEIQNAFVLRNTSSIVEVEITEWISFSDDMVTEVFDPNNL